MYTERKRVRNDVHDICGVIRNMKPVTWNRSKSLPCWLLLSVDKTLTFFFFMSILLSFDP